MLEERAKYYYENEDCNCAESIIRSANDVYGLGIDEAGLRSYGSFGAGMYCGSTCGALCGAMGALGAKEIETCAHQTPELGAKCKMLYKEFESICGSTQCKEVRAKHYDRSTQCWYAIKSAANALEGILGNPEEKTKKR